MQFIYVIGAQCTGKTTLIEAVGAWLKTNKPQDPFAIIGETARTVLHSHQFTRNDVRAGGERCIQLQKLIFQGQLEAERRCLGSDLVISDRSGIDPLVYTQLYCGLDAVQEMVKSDQWPEQRLRMMNGTVVVCEPVKEWLHDDGTRLIPESNEEWMATHKMFYDALNRYQIPHVVLTADTIRVSDRVRFVLASAGLG